MFSKLTDNLIEIIVEETLCLYFDGNQDLNKQQEIMDNIKQQKRSWNIQPHILRMINIAEVQCELITLGFEFGALNFMSFAPRPITCISRQQFIEVNFHSNFLTIENTAKINSEVIIKYDNNWQNKCINSVKEFIKCSLT